MSNLERLIVNLVRSHCDACAEGHPVLYDREFHKVYYHPDLDGRPCNATTIRETIRRVYGGRWRLARLV